MKTKAELQSAVDELRSVCKKHKVILLGTCTSEGIYGEITIGENKEKVIGWSNPLERVTNQVEEWDGWFQVNGIGDIED